MADNEGTDSSVEAESTGEPADPKVDPAQADEDDASNANAPTSDDGESPASEADDGESPASEADDDVTAESAPKTIDDSAAVGSVVEDEGELVERVTDHEAELGEAVEELVDWSRDLQERVFELESVADELETTVEEKDDEIEDLSSRLKRKQADFQNYKKRAKKRQEQIKERAAEDLVERLLDVRNDLVRALESDHEDVESFRDGVEMTLREFDRVLEDEDVEEISPDPGDEMDPQRHEVMVQVDSEHPEGTIHDVYDAGYEMAGKILQPARVTISNGAEHDPEAEDTDAGEAADAADGDADTEATPDDGEGADDPSA